MLCFEVYSLIDCFMSSSALCACLNLLCSIVIVLLFEESSLTPLLPSVLSNASPLLFLNSLSRTFIVSIESSSEVTWVRVSKKFNTPVGVLSFSREEKLALCAVHDVVKSFGASSSWVISQGMNSSKREFFSSLFCLASYPSTTAFLRAAYPSTTTLSLSITEVENASSLKSRGLGFNENFVFTTPLTFDRGRWGTGGRGYFYLVCMSKELLYFDCHDLLTLETWDYCCCCSLYFLLVERGLRFLLIVIINSAGGPNLK